MEPGPQVRELIASRPLQEMAHHLTYAPDARMSRGLARGGADDDTRAMDMGDKKRSALILVGAVCFVVGGWIASPFVLRELIPELTQRGLVGDSFGAINALFSGLAFFGVVYAILLQRADLKVTHEEMRRQAKAAEESKDAIEKQRKATLLGSAITAQAEISRLADWLHNSNAGPVPRPDRAGSRIASLEDLLKRIERELES